MSMISHAQNFEDVRLWRAFADIECGRYLDIGTQEPVHDSVSLAFYERGWRGVHVEPTPAYADAIRAARPDETVIQAAVCTAPGPLTFFEIPQTGLSTGHREIAEGHAAQGWPYRTIEVPTISLAMLFDRMGPEPIHWLKIDVEGMEADVLASWGEHTARPAALVIEATAPNSQIPTHAAWHAMVTARGYREVAFDGLSRYFVHADHDHRGEALALCPNVFDQFRIPATHFAAGALVAAHEADVAAAVQQAETAQESLAAAQRDLNWLHGRLFEQGEAHQAALAAERDLAARALAEAARMQAALDAGQDRLTKAEADLAAAAAAAKEAGNQLIRKEKSHADELSRLRGAVEAARAAAKAERSAAMRAAAAAERRYQALACDLADARSLLLARAEANAAEQARLGAAVAAAEAGRAAEADAATRRVEALETQIAAASARAEAIEGERAAEADAAVRRVEVLETQIAAASARAEAIEAERARLQQAGEQQAARLAGAARLLAFAPDPWAVLPGWLARGVRWLAARDHLQALAAHRADVARWQADTARAGAVPGDELSLAGNMPVAEAGMIYGGEAMGAETGPITSVPPLVAHHDRAFVHAAYQAVLGRAPDADGETYYLARLRAGEHKLAILKQLRRSPEGRAFIPGVAGLDRAIKHHRLATLPVIGVLVRAVTGWEGNSAAERQLRVLANEIGRLRDGQAALAGYIHELARRPVVAAGHPAPVENANAEQEPRQSLQTLLENWRETDSFDAFLMNFKDAVARSSDASNFIH